MPLERIEKIRVPAITPVMESLRSAVQTEGMEKQIRVLGDLAEVRQAVGDIECTKNKITPIDYHTYRAINSFDSRVRFLVIHYTAADFKASIELLTQGAASVHYLVPDPSDPSYREMGHTDVKIFNLVDEKDRAWHAGASSWGGRNNLNDSSIGIEIVNQATDDGNGDFMFPPFNPRQISAVKQLAANIIQRYPEISPKNVVGHSDIAPGRKSDPGAAFPWQLLSEAGIGAWYDERAKEEYAEQFRQTMPTTNDIISKLKNYGYDIAKATDSNDGLKDLVRAFQLHFRSTDYSGKIDIETAAILYALVEKYP